MAQPCGSSGSDMPQMPAACVHRCVHGAVATTDSLASPMRFEVRPLHYEGGAGVAGGRDESRKSRIRPVNPVVCAGGRRPQTANTSTPGRPYRPRTGPRASGLRPAYASLRPVAFDGMVAKRDANAHGSEAGRHSNPGRLRGLALPSDVALPRGETKAPSGQRTRTLDPVGDRGESSGRREIWHLGCRTHGQSPLCDSRA